jgi:hypothetical protein
MAPETARFIPTRIATNTRGSRMFQTTRLCLFISGTSAPKRNAFHAFGSRITPGSNTACHASTSVIENAPKLTCTRPPRTTITTLPPHSVRSDPSNQPSHRSR